MWAQTKPILIISLLWWGSLGLLGLVEYLILQDQAYLINKLMEEKISNHIQHLIYSHSGSAHSSYVFSEDNGQWFVHPLYETLPSTPKPLPRIPIQVHSILIPDIDGDFSFIPSFSKLSWDIPIGSTIEGHPVYFCWHYHIPTFLHHFEKWGFLCGLLYILLILILVFWYLKPLRGLKIFVHHLQNQHLISPEDFGILPKHTDHLQIIHTLTNYFTSQQTVVKSLSEKLQHLEELLQKHLTLHCRCDIQGQLIEVPTAFCHFTGKTEEHLLHQPFSHFVHPEDQKQLEPLFCGDLKINHLSIYLRMLDKTGKLYWFLWEWNLLTKEQNQPPEWLGIGIDRTVEQNTKQELQQILGYERQLWKLGTDTANKMDPSEDIPKILAVVGSIMGADNVLLLLKSPNYNQKTVLDYIPQWTWRKSIYTTPKFQPSEYDLTLFSWAGSILNQGKELIIDSIHQLPPEASQEKEILQSLGVQSLVLHPLCQNNKLMAVLVCDKVLNSTIWNRNRLPLFYLAGDILANTIIRGKTFQEIQKSIQRFRQLLESLPVGIILVDVKTRQITEANSAFCELVQCRQNELVGLSLFSLFDSPIPYIEKTKSTWSIEDQLKVPNSMETIPVLRQVSSLELEGEKYFLETIIDLRQRKTIEQARLLQERLQGVLEMAGATCHELNQPLQVISGYTELLLLQVSPSDKIYSKIQAIYQQAKRLGELTNKINNITSYHTQDYLGNRIIDIHKASQNPIKLSSESKQLFDSWGKTEKAEDPPFYTPKK